MTADPLVLLPEVDRATARLLATVRGLAEADLAAHSVLPGWTRGHVLAHLALNADACVNLLASARTGVDTPMYASDEQRDADIADASGRSGEEHAAALVSAAKRFDSAVAEMSPEAWTAVVRMRRGFTAPAAYVPWARLREIEVHHADLDAGYTSADWPDWFTQRLLHEVGAEFEGRMSPVRLHADDTGHEYLIGADPATTVSGPGHEIAAWLCGRSRGAGLSVGPAGQLPTVPNWK
jgi:maleylpyruvate isomerase